MKEERRFFYFISCVEQLLNNKLEKNKYFRAPVITSFDFLSS